MKTLHIDEVWNRQLTSLLQTQHRYGDLGDYAIVRIFEHTYENDQGDWGYTTDDGSSYAYYGSEFELDIDVNDGTITQEYDFDAIEFE